MHPLSLHPSLSTFSDVDHQVQISLLLLTNCDFMNNLNQQNWNIPPDCQDGGGKGSKWDYISLLSLLGVGVLDWARARKSQKEIEIEQIRAEHKNTEKDLVKYQHLSTQSELEQKKLKSKVQRFCEGLSAQSRQLVEERRQLQVGLTIEQKKHAAAEREAMWESQARALIKQFQDSLLVRQSIYCSRKTPKCQRLELETKMRNQALTNPIAKELGIEADLEQIFKHETHCANVFNSDKKENGRLMWVYLAYWRFQARLQILEKEAALLEKQDN
ncbi:coiled-coil domain-containing protein 127-like [Cetorhinus maximus]